ncbi:MAG: undecaprenyldiphospho-muramoylpentapeptide beta-N-acetylglucosaminyltransferase [Eubacterium sp.]|nr:undecaprenyldiphospho-muramoylpentapeptide beta-N-acetylglucosaminyltransferase [Eubacterium sp.]
MKRIVMTGGGTAGHVTPNIALLPTLKKNGYEVYYIGSYNGIEKELVKDCNVKYFGISSGKLRRYFDIKNFTDPFRVIKGYFQAKSLIKKIKPDVVFSKGGFVSVPVVIAAGKKHIPTIIHESDITPGLANKLAIPHASKVCCNFPETLNHLPKDKALLTGSPIREELLFGDAEKGRSICGFDASKPMLMIIGGSTGAKHINDTVRSCLDDLLEKYNIVHLCGKGMKDDSLVKKAGYIQFEYVKDDLKHLFAAADVVISRAGANAICELLALKKPNLLIPLSAAASRGDQILNAKSFKKMGFSSVLEEENLTPDTLKASVDEVFDNRIKYINAMENSPMPNAINTIFSLIEEIS